MKASHAVESKVVSFGLSQLSEPDAFRAAISRILELNRNGAEIVLDFSDLRLTSSQRVRPFNLLLLANVVATTASTSPARLVMPQDDNGRLLVLRSGLLFSLVSRRKPVGVGDIDGLAERPVVARWLDLWKQPWSPVQPAFGRLFDDEPRPVDEPTVLSNLNNAKRATRIVVDPHLLSRDALMQHAAQGLAGAWLRSVTPDSSDERRREARTVWQSLVTSRVLGEPLINLPDHATARPVLAEPLRRAVRSLVLLARTDGGGTDSQPRLHIVVADTGYGIVNTLRPHLHSATASKEERSVAEGTSIDVLNFAMTRPAKTVNDPGLPWARDTFGVAVGKATAEDRPLDVEFTVVTGDPEHSNDTIWARAPASGRSEDVVTDRVSGVPFIGTTVFACLPIPHLVADRVKDSGASTAD